MYIKPKNNDVIGILREGFKVTGHSKIKFFVGFPPSIRDFFLLYNL